MFKEMFIELDEGLFGASWKKIKYDDIRKAAELGLLTKEQIKWALTFQKDPKNPKYYEKMQMVRQRVATLEKNGELD